MSEKHTPPDDTEALARTVAEILGPGSGAAKAVALLDGLRAAGQAPLLVQERGKWVVIHEESAIRALKTQEQ